jgi:hypothetical protein
MARYIRFLTADGHEILVEVERDEVSPSSGVVKAGLKDRVEDAVGVAQATYEAALERIIHHSVNAFIQSVRGLPHPPTEVEVTFGIKATGEAGNVAVGKVGGEANFAVKLAWKNLTLLETQATAPASS